MPKSITIMLAELKKILKNNNALAYTALGMFFLQGTNFISGLLLARYLSPADFGKFQLLITLVTTTAIITKMGLDEGFVYFVPKIRKNNNDEKIFTIYSISVVLLSSFFVGLIVFVFANFINESLLRNIEFLYELNIFVIYLLSFALFTIVNAILRGYEYFNFRALLVYYLNPLFFLSVILILIFKHESLELQELYSIRIFIYLLIGCIGIFFFMTKFVKDNQKNNLLKTYKDFHKFSIALVFLTLVEFLAEQPTIDLLILANLTSAYDIGIYSVNYKIAALMLITYLAFQVIYTSKFSSYYTERNFKELVSLYKSTKKKMLILSMVLFSILFVSYDFIIPLFGDEYKEGKIIFLLLSIGFAVFSMGGLNNIILIIFQKKKFLASVDLLFIILLILIGVILVNLTGIIGMSIANSILFIISTIIKKRIVSKMIADKWQ